MASKGYYYKDTKTIYDQMTMKAKEDGIDVDENSLMYYADYGVADAISYTRLLMDESIKRMTVNEAYDSNYIDDVIAKCNDVCIFQKEKTKATTRLKFTGRAKSKFPSGGKVVTKKGIIFVTNTDVILDDEGIGYCNATAEDYGKAYNTGANTLTNFVKKYDGILTVTNEEEVLNGYDDESIDSLVERYYEYIQTDETSGNVAHYKKWCKETNGIGNASIYECTNELKEEKEGHVLCVVCDSNNRAIKDQAVLDNLAKYIETKRPACAKVHVLSCNEIKISFSCEILFNSKTISLDDCTTLIKDYLNEYLKENAFELTSLDINKLESIAYAPDEIIKLKNFKVTIGDNTYTSSDVIDIGADTVIVLDEELSTVSEIEI